VTQDEHGDRGPGRAPFRGAIALIGLRCSGKTSVGEALARRLARPFVDLDREIVALARREGRPEPSAGELLAAIGEPAFRALEARALRATLDAGTPCVLATGGGVVEQAANRARLAERATCVWLCVPPAELARRMRADPTPRPSLTGAGAVAEIEALAARRDPWFAALAALRVAAGTGPASSVAAEIERLLGTDGGSR
jgi:shikimate kinase